MDVKKELGAKIKRIRQKEGLTQEQFAEKINIATRTLAGIEIGESFVSSQIIIKILVKEDREKIENIYKVVKALANG